MTVVTLTPDATVTLFGPVVTGAATADGALSDGSDSSYLTFDSFADHVLLSFTDLSLPAGAVVTRLQAQLRDRVPSGSPLRLDVVIYAPSTNSRSAQSAFPAWTSFADQIGAQYTPPSLGATSDSDVDDARIGLFATTSMTGGQTVVVSELALLVTYVAQPVVDISAPTGTVSDTNAPTVIWADTLDSDGGTAQKYDLKIFSAAQYGAGGFNPSSSTPTLRRFVGSDATSWTLNEPLPDGTYRAYIRIAQTVLGSDHYSDWDYSEFTIAANAPGVPSIHVVAEDDEGRIWITLDDTLGATTHKFEVQRSIDSGSTWETIRTTDSGLITPSGGIGRAYDTEIGNGVTVTYRARALNIIAFTTYSAWSSSTTPTAWQSSSWWLKSPLHPDLNIPVEIGGMDDITQEANQGVFGVLGRRNPIIVSDIRAGFRGTVRFVFDDDTERDELQDLLDLLEPLLLQAPPSNHWTDRYLMLGSLTRARGIDKAFVGWTVEALPWVEVDQPAGDIVEWPAFAS